MYKERLSGIVNKFEGQKVILAGDLMLDISETGKIRKVSPEDACFVISNPRIDHYLGGVGNVFANIMSLGGDPYLCGVIGDDENGKKLMRVLSEKYKGDFSNQGIAVIPGRQTTIKRRSHVNGGHYIRQIIRTDFEDVHEISDSISEFILMNIEEHFKNTQVSIIAVSDYAKGFLTQVFVQELIFFARKRQAKVIVDPKPLSGDSNKLRKFVDCYGFKPNLEEAEVISGIKYDGKNLKNIGKKCLEILKPKGFVLVTHGKNGMYIFNAENDDVDYIPGKEVEVSDITGAGDTVLGALALSLSTGAALIDAATIANLAAAEKVKKRGTATVSKKELVDLLE